MSEIKDTALLAKLKNISENNRIVEYTIYAYIPKRKKVKVDRDVYKDKLVHEYTKVYTSTDINEIEDVFDEYERFDPAIEAKIHMR